jgi:thioredoxin reductase (NADPH)
MERLDCAIIGTGPAGLEAALNLKIRGKKFALFGRRGLSEKLRLAPKVENYLGLPDITGESLRDKMLEHLERMGIAIDERQVGMAYHMGSYVSLTAGQDVIDASTLILATGAYSAGHFKGELEFLGRGVSFCATCDAPLYRGKTVAVAGLSEEAPHEAAFLATLAARVYYVPTKKHPIEGPAGNIEVVEGKIEEILGDKKVTGLTVGGRQIPVDGVFVLRSSVAPSSLLPGLELEDGFIKTDSMMRTNLAGVFAAGDCTGKPHQYIRAAGQGQVAAFAAVDYLSQK